MVSGYEVTMDATARDGSPVTQTLTTAAQNITVENLVPATLHTFTVRAIVDGSTGGPSDSAAVYTAVEAPDAVSNPRASLGERVL